MDVKLSGNDALTALLEVTLPAEQAAQAYQAAADAVRAELSLKGFRRGKVPKSLVLQKCHAEICTQAQNSLVEASVQRALQQHKIRTLGAPHIIRTPFDPKALWKYTIFVETEPTLGPTQYAGLRLPAVDSAVAEADVDAQLQQMRRKSAEMAPVVGRNIAQRGDFVLLEYRSRLRHGLRPINHERDIWVELAPEMYLPGFVEGIEGALVPGRKDVELTLPSTWPKHLADKQARFEMQFKELKCLQLPELDDEFAKDMGATSLAELRETVARQLAQKKAAAVREQHKQTVMVHMLKHNPFEAPPSMVDAVIEGRLAQMRSARKAERQRGLDAAELAELRGQWRQDADFQVRWLFLAQHIAQEQHIVVDKASMSAEMRRLSAQSGAQVETIAQFFKDPRRQAQLEERVLNEQVLAFLLDRAQRTEAAEPAALPAPDAP